MAINIDIILFIPMFRNQSLNYILLLSFTNKGNKTNLEFGTNSKLQYCYCLLVYTTISWLISNKYEIFFVI